MNLLEQIETIVNEQADGALDGTIVNAGGVAVSIHALISAHLASDEAVERARNAYCEHPFAHQCHSGAHRAALAAALGEE